MWHQIQICIVQFLSLVVTFAILLVRKFLLAVSLENQDLGSGPRFPVVHYRGPLPSPILTVQALRYFSKIPEILMAALTAQSAQQQQKYNINLSFYSTWNVYEFAQKLQFPVLFGKLTIFHATPKFANFGTL